MAKKTQRESSDLAEDPLVASLVPDPSQGPPNTMVLAGYLGRGTEEGVWRLYLTPELNEYVEIPAHHVLHQESLPDDRSTQIWVRSDLDVRYVRTQIQRIPASQIGKVPPRTLSLGPRIRGTGGPRGAAARTVVDALPFALATAHHAPAQVMGEDYYTNKYAKDKKERDERPKFPWRDKLPWGDDPGYGDPVTAQYDQLLTDYLDLLAAYEELRPHRG